MNGTIKLITLLAVMASVGCGHAKIVAKDCHQVGERVYECTQLD